MPRPPVLWRMVLALAAGPVMAATEAGSKVREALRDSLPKYDPTLREQALAEKAAAEEEMKQDTERAQPAAPAARARQETDGTIALPEVIVEGRRERSRPPPRMHRPIPPGNANIEPFASPAEKDRQLVKKHFTPLEQAMNRFHLPLFGAPLTAYARQAEAKLQYANQLDQLAAMIAYMEAQGASKEEIAKLRALYMDLYLARPK